ncbi:MAG TPA: adenylate/guanylate cyclase domain-containing protein [Gaiellaceae bacterium]|jgi:class 3 adenylate cyclase/tetratricopeptide (TPR) repeat protein
MAEARKTVTVVFSDVAGSTSLGERLDPEALRRVMERYFAEMQPILERHGGTVEKFIGDAIMAVFGIPTAHEDDAHRAVRAAVEMRERLTGLNAELERERGVTLAARTGVNTGEVVAGDPGGGQFYATGDAVNVAARLEQAAEAGEILLGQQTRRLVQTAVEVESLQPLRLKGKAEAVAAYRLIKLIEDVPGLARRYDTPFVGRGAQLASLVAAFERAVSERTPVLATVLGPAGIGKTRLAGELVAEVRGRSTVLHGRCLPYGEGITFWPLQEILLSLPERPPGVPDPNLARSTEETFWAYRKLFGALAEERPLTLLFEDIHWAEPTLLDLIEHVVEWTQDVPMLIVCLARHELLDERAGWPGERIELEPLPTEAAATLIATLAPEVDSAVQARAAAVAEGNPLFLEQLLALAGEGGGELTVPYTIQALLAARLDRLDSEERSVLEAAAVVGKEFSRGALLHLCEQRAEVSALLQRLVRRRLIQPTRSTLPGEDGFRFGHILIRDATYGAIPKESRAELHGRFADWLETEGSPYLEIVGYHLEHAYRYRAELGPVDDALRALGDRAGDRLERAGTAALARGDAQAAVNLIERARQLLSDPDKQLALALPLAEALEYTGRLENAQRLLDETIAAAQTSKSRQTEWLARIADAHMTMLLTPEQDEQVEVTADLAHRVFEQLGDDLGLARALTLAGEDLFTRCKYDEASRRFGRALVHARRTGDEREELSALLSIISAMYYGSAHVSDVQPQAEAFRARAHPSDVRGLQFLAGLRAMAGAQGEAQTLYRQAKAIAAELGLRTGEAVVTMFSEEVGLIFGDAAFARDELGRGYDILEEMGERGLRSTVAAQLAEALYALGRHEEAERFADISLELTASDDIASQSRGRAAKAKSLAARGEHEAAERLAREAVELARNTDSLFMQGQLLMGLAEVLRVAGHPDDVVPVLEEAAGVNERKGNVVTAGKARAQLSELQAAPRSSR